MRSPRDGERGSGTVLALAVAAATVVIAVAATGLGAAFVARQRVVGAADQAALAAADTARGLVGGVPCARAAEVARAHRTALVSCRMDGWIATVTVSATLAGLQLRASSTAGPPP